MKTDDAPDHHAPSAEDLLHACEEEAAPDVPPPRLMLAWWREPDLLHPELVSQLDSTPAALEARHLWLVLGGENSSISAPERPVASVYGPDGGSFGPIQGTPNFAQLWSAQSLCQHWQAGVLVPRWYWTAPDVVLLSPEPHRTANDIVWRAAPATPGDLFPEEWRGPEDLAVIVSSLGEWVVHLWLAHAVSQDQLLRPLGTLDEASEESLLLATAALAEGLPLDQEGALPVGTAAALTDPEAQLQRDHLAARTAWSARTALARAAAAAAQREAQAAAADLLNKIGRPIGRLPTGFGIRDGRAGEKIAGESTLALSAASGASCDVFVLPGDWDSALEALAAGHPPLGAQALRAETRFLQAGRTDATRLIGQWELQPGSPATLVGQPFVFAEQGPAGWQAVATGVVRREEASGKIVADLLHGIDADRPTAPEGAALFILVPR